MLLKVKLGGVQKYVKITEPNLTEFLAAGKIYFFFIYDEFSFTLMSSMVPFSTPLFMGALLKT